MKQHLEIPINVKMVVDESTAQGCLKIVEIYLNGNADLHLKAVTKETGEVELSYEPAQ